MNNRPPVLLAIVAAGLALCQAAFAQEAQSQVCERTRAEVRSECVDFLQKHRWDEAAGDYVLKSTGKPAASAVPPEGVMTRQQIRAERDAFLRAYRWNESTSSWEALVKKPREVSKLSREEVRRETAAFMKTHQWSEAQGRYLERKTN